MLHDMPNLSTLCKNPKSWCIVVRGCSGLHLSACRHPTLCVSHLNSWQTRCELETIPSMFLSEWLWAGMLILASVTWSASIFPDRLFPPTVSAPLSLAWSTVTELFHFGCLFALCHEDPALINDIKQTCGPRQVNLWQYKNVTNHYNFAMVSYYVRHLQQRN